MEDLIAPFVAWAAKNLSPLDFVFLAGLVWSRYELYSERKIWNDGRETTLKQSAENAKVWNDMAVALAGLQANMVTVITMLTSRHRG